MFTYCSQVPEESTSFYLEDQVEGKGIFFEDSDDLQYEWTDARSTEDNSDTLPSKPTMQRQLEQHSKRLEALERQMTSISDVHERLTLVEERVQGNGSAIHTVSVAGADEDWRDSLEERMATLSALVMRLRGSLIPHDESRRSRKSGYQNEIGYEQKESIDSQEVLNDIPCRTVSSTAEFDWDHHESLYKQEVTGHIHKCQSSLQTDHRIITSVWEMSIVAGVDVLSKRDSLGLLLACLLNMVLESMFLAVLFIISEIWGESCTHCKKGGLNVDVLKKWRNTVAHDVNYVSELQRESLASRVCRQDETLGYHNSMSAMVGSVNHFLQPVGIFPHVGPLLSVAVLAVWIMQCSKELVSTFSFISAVLNLPGGPKTKVRNISRGESSLSILTISRIRKASMFALTLLRLYLCMCLLVFGCMWLAAIATDLTEQLLGAVSLAFILDIDELCFETVAPNRVRAIHGSLTPLLKKQHTHKLQQISAHIAGSFLFFYMLHFHVRPLANNLNAVSDAVCGGNKDFAVAVNEGTKLVYASPTREYVRGGNIWPDGMPRDVEVVESLARSSSLLDEASVVWMKESLEMKTTARDPIEQFTARRFLQCGDSVEKRPTFVLKTLQRHNVNPTATTCDGLKGSCYELDQNLLRLICPASCGAASPHSGQILVDSKHGIIPEICSESDTYRSSLAAIPCRDKSQEELHTMPGWNRTWHQFVEIHGRFADLEPCYREIADTFQSRGCNFLFSNETKSWCLPHEVDAFCSAFTGFPNLAVFCPVACGCRATNHTACPPACTLD